MAQVTPEKCWSGSVTASLVFPVPAGLELWAQNTEFSITFLSLLTEGESGGLWEWLCWCWVCQSQGRSSCASEVLLLAQTPRQLGHGAWVTLAEMSAEPALALSAFTVSCKVNQMLLCDDKCYSWKSSWKKAQHQASPKMKPRLTGFCSAEALQCVEHQGAVQHQGGARAGCSGCFWNLPCIPQKDKRKRLLSLYWVELSFWPPLRVWCSELGEAMSCAL